MTTGGLSGCTHWVSRNRVLVGVALGVVVLAVVLGVAVGVPLSKRQATGPAMSDRDRAKNILRRYPLVDGHNDLAWQIFVNSNNTLASINLAENMMVQWPDSWFPPTTDIPRLRQGMVGAQFWAVFSSCTTQAKDAVRVNLEQLDVIKRFVKKYSDTFKLVTTSEGIVEAFKENKIGGLLGLEGGHAIDSSLAVLRVFYELGVRYMTLTHNCNTPWADNHNAITNSSLVQSDGLSPFGEIVVREMNRLGMLIDLSHVSQATMRDSLRLSKAPVIYSHSSAYALCNNSRNVPDDVLRLTRDNGGVVMVNYYPPYVSCEATNATLEQTADHVDHIHNVAGADHVGLGADYDGVPYFPEGLKDVSTYPALFEELLNRGWSEEDLEKLAGRNIVRALSEAEKVRDKMAKDGVEPYEDLINPDLVKNNNCRTPFHKATNF